MVLELRAPPQKGEKVDNLSTPNGLKVDNPLTLKHIYVSTYIRASASIASPGVGLS